MNGLDGLLFGDQWQFRSSMSLQKMPFHLFLHHLIDPIGSVEKSRQRRSRHFSVLTYSAYAPREKMAAALLDGLF
jgi:hypothetical protein